VSLNLGLVLGLTNTQHISQSIVGSQVIWLGEAVANNKKATFHLV